MGTTYSGEKKAVEGGMGGQTVGKGGAGEAKVEDRRSEKGGRMPATAVPKGGIAVHEDASSFYGCELPGKRTRGSDIRARVGVRRGRIAPELLEYLCEEALALSSEAELDAHPAMSRNVDLPQLRRHAYFEGVMHGLATGERVDSMHPRFGLDFHKPPLPSRLRAFSCALRHANSAWIDDLATEVERVAEEGAGECATTLARLLREGHAFADAAYQVHAYEEVEEDDAGWHVDAPNSTLHLALSLKGRRALLYRSAARHDTPDSDLEVVRVEQEPGDVYVSSPFAFHHAVSYDCEGAWEERVIAVQFRLLVNRDDLDAMMASSSDWGPVMRTVTDKLLHADGLRLPTLEEVQDCEAATLKTASG